MAARNKSFEETFTFSNLYQGYLASRKGVGWKASTQTYKANASANVRREQRALMDGTWKSKGFYHFDLFDRGKLRHIRSVHISERVIQHTLCDELLTPVLTPTLIYDNCGSLKHKGMDFAIKRCTDLLREQVRKHGDDLYVLTYDFSGYFDNIDHGEAMRLIERYITDPRNVKLVRQLVDDFGAIGLGLGSQVSQTIATSLPSSIDHAIKEKMQIRSYIRYMDDGLAISHDLGLLERCLELLKKMCAALHIRLNEKKTAIHKMEAGPVGKARGFVFLKMRFTITPTGGILRRVASKTITRSRRKVKKLFGLFRQGKIRLEDIDCTMASIEGHLKRGSNYNARKNLRNLYNKLLWEALKCT